MSFDPRSRERLEALGRTLPSKLPLPAVTPSAAPPAASAAAPPSGAPSRDTPAAGARPIGSPEAARRHRLETEQNPEALFHALIQASPDGTVPPHHLERLRSLEQQQPRTLSSSSSAFRPALSSPVPSSPASAGRRRRGSGTGSAPRRLDGPEQDLYAAFEDLLQQQEDDAEPAPAPARRPPDERFLNRPTLRPRPTLP